MKQLLESFVTEERSQFEDALKRFIDKAEEVCIDSSDEIIDAIYKTNPRVLRNLTTTILSEK